MRRMRNDIPVVQGYETHATLCPAIRRGIIVNPKKKRSDYPKIYW